jgi:sulfate adenylyltransferase
VTTQAPADAGQHMAKLPAWTPGERGLGDLELLMSGAFAPLASFMGSADVAALAEWGTLADGTPWPAPITLDVPARAVPADAGQLLLQDPEGASLALLRITERTALGPPAGQAPAEAGGTDALVRLAGPVSPLRPPEHGAFRQLRRPPAEVRAELGDGPVLALATRAPLHGRLIGQLRHLADHMKARLLLLPLVAGPADLVVTPESLVRAVLAARQLLPAGTLVAPVPLAPRHTHDAEFGLASVVARAYGATHLFADLPAAGGRTTEVRLPGTAIPVVSPAEWAYDPAAEVWRPLTLIETGAERGELSQDELAGLLDRGDPLPAWHTPAAVARELRRARPPRHERGLVIFMTGLSGSGKSTIARDVRDALAERGDRTVSLLDGDQVRGLLSAGLSLSRADRDLDIARIGYVAAEIARHGGVAICAPIAPQAQARQRVREMVTQTGDFLLVYVSTPIDTCAARGRKGASDPYEEPEDADLVIDTSVISRQEAVGAVLDLLTKGGWLATDASGQGA